MKVNNLYSGFLILAAISFSAINLFCNINADCLSSNIVFNDSLIKNVPKDTAVYSDPTSEAIFPGGADSFKRFVTANFKMPKMAKKNGISGVIFIQFVVEKDSTVTNLKSIAPVERRLGYGLEEECMRVIKLTSGKWVPAKKAGEAVRSIWRFPFTVNNSKY